MAMGNRVPVFIINGFLESGKTTFIKETLLSDPNIDREKLLIICCEEGEEEYEGLSENLIVHVVEEKEELSSELFKELKRKYEPTLVLIEYNGVWEMEALYNTRLPISWTVADQLTIIDSTTFESYFNNMKNLFADMLRSSSRVFIKKCTRESDFKFLKNSVKQMSPRAEIFYINDEEGPMNIMLEEDLPYDLNAEVISLNEETYPIWYVDMLDNIDRYVGKTVEFDAQVSRPEQFREEFLLAGNMVLTCCEDDRQFWGLVCHYEKASFVKNGNFVKLRGEIRKEFAPEYNEEGGVIYIDRITSLPGKNKKKKK